MTRHLIVALALAAAPAAAAPQQARVSLAGLDLTTEAGVAALDRRIRLAADRLCGTWQAASLLERRTARACRAEAIASAEAQRARAIALARRMPERFAAG